MKKIVATLIVASCVIASVVVFFFSSRGTNIVEFPDLQASANASVEAPRFFRNGGIHVLYEGELVSDVLLEIRSNHGRDLNGNIRIKAGEVIGYFGEDEAWVDDLEIDVVPLGKPKIGKNQLRIGLFCGEFPRKSEADWFKRASEIKND